MHDRPPGPYLLTGRKGNPPQSQEDLVNKIRAGLCKISEIISLYVVCVHRAQEEAVTFFM
jgi:hypothetical protein